jgi:hypothetical protein
MSLDYDSILVSSWDTVLDKLEQGIVTLFSEDDLRCHLFHECLVSLGTSGVKPPFPIHAEVNYLDLLLGEGEVAVELKFPKKDAGGYTIQKMEILKDLEKLKQKKVKSAYFGIVSGVDYFFKPHGKNYVSFASLGFTDKVMVVRSPKAPYYCLLARLTDTINKNTQGKGTRTE